MTATDLALESLHTSATDLFRQSLDACSISSAFDRHIQFKDGKLHRVLSHDAGTSTVELKEYRRIFVISIGKVAVPMLNLLLDRMGRRKGLRGICCSNAVPEKRNWRIRYFCGGHPLPNEGSFAAARATLALLRKARKDTLVIFLISGGASALFDLPLDPEITVEDAVGFHQALIGSGAPITEINVIRKHFSAVKGGRLALAAPEATKLSILLPDVPLRSLETVASGPTLPDSTTEEDAAKLISKYDLLPKFPPRVAEFFKQKELPETAEGKSRRSALLERLPWSDTQGNQPRKGKTNEVKAEEVAFRNSMLEVLLSSQDLVENAQNLAEKAGYHAVVDNACDDWDYADAARYLLERFHSLRAEHPRCCLISGGEVTVTLNRTPGAGGRNQQFALACADDLSRFAGQPLAVLSAGSDGIDGNTRAAGAIADTTTVQRALAFGYDPVKALAEFDACPLFTALGDAVVTGPTGHNLRDLRLLISDVDSQIST